MNFAEACELLEVTAESSPDEARRAYLRRLKHCKPEVDPEGFRRLREAYETAKGVLESPPLLILARAGVGVEIRDSGGTTLSHTPPRGVDTLDGKAPDDEVPGEDEDETLWTDLRAADERGDIEEALKLARGAVEKGGEVFLEHIARHYPEHLKENERERLRHPAGLSSLAAGAHLLAARSRSRPALMLLEEVITALEASSAPVEGYCRELGQTLLHLARLGEHQALALGHRLQALVDRQGGLRQSGHIAFWKLVREAQALPAEMPGPARQAIVEALIEGDPGNAYNRLHRLHQENPELVSRAAALLPQGSMLFQLYYGFIQDLATTSRTEETRGSGFERWGLWFLIIMGISALGRHCS